MKSTLLKFSWGPKRSLTVVEQEHHTRAVILNISTALITQDSHLHTAISCLLTEILLMRCLITATTSGVFYQSCTSNNFP